MSGRAATTDSANAPSQRRLAPPMNSIPTRIAAKTREGPRAGWGMTRTPGGRPADASPDGEGEAEEAELDRIDRPRERLEPVVVERGRHGEDDERDPRPEETAQEDRAAGERPVAAGDGVAVGHREAEKGQQDRVGHQLEVEGAPDRPDGPCRPVGDSGLPRVDDAHRLAQL